MFKKSEGSSRLDRLQRVTPTVYGVHVAISCFVLIVLQNVHIWPSAVRIFMWAFVNLIYLAVWDTIYILLTINNLIRRCRIYSPVWITAAFLVLLTITTVRMMQMSIARCGGWENVIALLEAPFQEGWDPLYDRFLDPPGGSTK